MAKRCVGRVSRGRAVITQCSRDATVERDGKAFCYQHDPVAKNTQRDAWNREFKAKQDREMEIEREGKQLAKALGIRASVYYESMGRFSQCGPRRSLVVSFEDIQKIIALLQANDRED